MRSFGLLLISFIFTTIGYGQQDAKKLLDEVSSKVKTYKNIQIDFRYNLENTEENVSQETRGNVSLSGDKYVLEMLGIKRIFDGTNIYTIIPEDEEVTISKFDPNSDNEITPSKMLNFYENGYTAKMDIEQNVKGRKIQYIELIASDKNSDIKKILLGVDVQTKHIYKLIQVDSNNTKYTVTVQNFKTDLPLSNNSFMFDKNKYEAEGYYINHL